MGNLNGTFIYAGVDGEYAFNFKEKTFNNDGKSGKSVYWFNNRVNEWQAAVHVGFQFYRGTNVKFKYYLNNFIDRNYEASGKSYDVSNLTRYKSSQVMYVALTWQFRHDYKFKKEVEDVKKETLIMP